MGPSSARMEIVTVAVDGSPHKNVAVAGESGGCPGCQFSSTMCCESLNHSQDFSFHGVRAMVEVSQDSLSAIEHL